MSAPSAASSRTVSGRSRTIRAEPGRPGGARRAARRFLRRRRRPSRRPPLQRGELLHTLARPGCIARSKEARSSGCSASHGQKPVPKVSRESHRSRRVARPDPRRPGRKLRQTARKRRSNRRQQQLGAGVQGEDPGSSSAKTPSLASARSRRWRTSASALASRANSATGLGPSASVSGTRRSATIPSAFVSLPRAGSPTAAPEAGARSCAGSKDGCRHGVDLGVGDRCGSRGAGGRRGRRRPPAARRGVAASPSSSSTAHA